MLHQYIFHLRNKNTHPNVLADVNRKPFFSGISVTSNSCDERYNTSASGLFDRCLDCARSYMALQMPCWLLIGKQGQSETCLADDPTEISSTWYYYDMFDLLCFGVTLRT